MISETVRSELERVVHKENLITDPVQIERWQSTTFSTVQRIEAIVYPRDSAQVRAVLKLANHFHIPVYPICRGRNCGYGGTVPYLDGSLLIDMRRMDRITGYSEELAYVRLQAGVTQEQLAAFLQAEGGRLWMDPIATFADCSVVGNILERGHGLSAHSDRIASATDFTIILANGEQITTGFHNFSEARLANLDRWLPGPSLDGLFSQSNFGIVTEMTVWLAPKPELSCAVAFELDHDELFMRVIDALRPLRLNGSIKFGPRFYSDFRLIQSYSSYPWAQMKGQTPVSDSCRRQLQEEMKIPRWLGVVGFHGTKKQIEADSEAALAEIEKVSKVIFKVDENSSPPDSLSERFVHSLFRGMTGHVSKVTERPRWRLRRAKAHDDWSQDQAGIIWFPVSAPFRGRDVMEAVNLIRQTVQEFKFEPDMSVSAIRDRTLEINSSIVFDRADRLQDEAAIPCVRETLERLSLSGFFPHRTGLATAFQLEAMDEGYRKLVASLKSTFDPNHILAAGRYNL